MSYRQLQRVLKNLGLRRKNKEENLDDIIICILSELESSGSCLGYKSLWHRLKTLHGLDVKRQTVLDILRIVDQEGIVHRSKYRLKRRTYNVPGPNFIWHIDGYDKLKPFDFAIHGCIDGFSRKVMWLELATSNNKPEIICYYYLKAAQKFKQIPAIIRSDHGTENSTVEIVHQALRSGHSDPYAGLHSFIKGKSTANQRVESSWGRMRRHSVEFWINFFKDMVECRDFDRSNKIQVECLRFCFAPLIKFDLEQTRKGWNRHNIRKQKCDNVKSGKPNFMYYVPNAVQCANWGQEVKKEHIENAIREFTETPTYCNSDFVKLVNDIFPGLSTPANVEEATILYHQILNEINQYNDNDDIL
ncbi:uncharacterized protein LOC100680052 [Nasonia vitripennis]|uniref:Integrase core domain-containing protein n=1 Tax=Nasonia vitripennis TaxID=7425 RepID=A0A7M7GDY2_NASVI|nr:uncharacterized protein LOC100680052 [Nasonia vitripennis]